MSVVSQVKKQQKQQHVKHNQPLPPRAPPNHHHHRSKSTPPRIPDFTDIIQIGKGAYGTVYRAKHIPSGRTFAIKQLENIFSNGVSEVKRLLREIKILRLLRNHPYVLHYYKAMVPSNLETYKTIYLIFESITMDLSQVLTDKKQNSFSANITQYILFQLLSATHYMHGCNILHRDVKPQNILISEYCDIRVCDFNLSRFYSTTSPNPPPPPSSFSSTSSSSTIIKNNNNIQNPRKKVKRHHHHHHSSKQPKQQEQQEQQEQEQSEDLSRNTSLVSTYVSTVSLSTSSLAADLDADVDVDVIVLPHPELSRALTEHVITRFYRPPEVIGRFGYGKSADIWSIGCVAVEVFTMQHSQRRSRCLPLFCGEDGQDQMNKILHLLGSTLTSSTSSCTTTSTSTKKTIDTVEYYLQSLRKLVTEMNNTSNSDLQSVSFEEKVNPQHLKDRQTQLLIELIRRMLDLNPVTRITTEEALKHPFFDSLKENYPSVYMFLQPPAVSLEYFSFDQVDENELSIEDIRKLITTEILLDEGVIFHPIVQNNSQHIQHKHISPPIKPK